jgi:hypothetical protein
VIAIEVFDGRKWHEEVSPDGVVSYVTYLAPRALVEPKR